MSFPDTDQIVTEFTGGVQKVLRRVQQFTTLLRTFETQATEATARAVAAVAEADILRERAKRAEAERDAALARLDEADALPEVKARKLAAAKARAAAAADEIKRLEG